MSWLDDFARQVFGRDVGLFHDNDPDTSLDAAEKVSAARQRLQVFHALHEAGDDGLTQDELAERVRHPQPHVPGTRRGELQKFGLVRRTERTRLSAQGNPAGVYVLDALGTQLYSHMANS